MYDTINNRIKFLYDRVHKISYAFFTGLREDKTVKKLANIFFESVIFLWKDKKI